MSPAAPLHGPPIRPVVVAPTYNNAATLIAILDRITALGLSVIVVDDGCTDTTPTLLSEWSSRQPDGAARVLRHSRNRGKAAALLSGFAAAAEAGFTHAVSIDTDGQLDPESIPALLEAASASPNALVLGARPAHMEHCPGRSTLGRRLSNAAIARECGARLSDSQCGLRVYPLDLVAPGVPGAVRCRAGRYGFEAEVITRAAWAGRQVVQVPVPCRYPPAPERVSHFKPWRDSIHGAALHASLLASALVRRGDARPIELEGESLARRLGRWISPRRAWAQVRESDASQSEIALGLAIGVFIANLPLYGVQTLLSLLAARQLHLHPLPVVAGSHASTPPVGIALAAAAIALGHRLRTGEWLWLRAADLVESEPWRMAGLLALDWAIGSIAVGALTAAAAFAAASWLLRLVPRRATAR